MDRRSLVLLALSVLAGCPTPGNRRDTGAPLDTSSEGCGNGSVDPGEECDGTDLDGETCMSQGFDRGTLGCTATCRFDKSMCESTCGNDSIDTGEDCDGTDLNAGTCASEGFASGTLGCNGDCSYNTTGCTRCGNGAVDMGEGCDGAAFGGATCASLGFTSGTLACTATCSVDTAGCSDANCGNAILDDGEDCDGTAFGTRTCASFGYATGTLGCNADCTADTDLCTNCGNGTVNASEACDGTALGGQTCATAGFTSGTLGCTSSCALDTTGCTRTACGNGMVESGETCDDGNATVGDGCAACAPEAGYACTGAPSSCDPVCGDGMIVGAETCDGANLAGRTCIALGYPGGGTLACSASTCTFNTAGCLAGTCGNGTLNTGEECDDGNAAAFDGCSATCVIEATYDLPVRLTGGPGSNRGRVEVWQAGSWRDVCDDGHEGGGEHANVLANVVCRQLGYTGTGHRVVPAFGGGTATPVMDDVVCTGSEPNLSQCAFSGWGRENCDAFEALGVECLPAEGDIRLAGGPNGMDGRLQIFHAGAWGEVCDDVIDGRFGGGPYGPPTVCTQLGYRTGAHFTTTAPSDAFVLDDVNCSGGERRIDACPHSAYGVENCFSGEGMGVRCELYREGDARLIAGTSRRSGRVEVLRSSIWGTVCDDIYTTPLMTSFVQTACRNLGFPGAGSMFTAAAGVDPILYDDVMCAGTETNIPMCPALPVFSNNCSHAEDVGVTCTP